MDGSFLRVETASAHMHVAWSATLRVPAAIQRPTLARLRRHVAARLEGLPRFRRRLAYPPPGMGEPFWVDDPDFDVAQHVLSLGTTGYELDDRRFEMLCDSVLSVPLARDRPLWEIRLAPRMSEGRCGLVAKMHHALVDGRSALEVAQLLFDAEPHTDVSPMPVRFEAPQAPGAGRLGARALVMGAEDSLRAARGAARMAGEPRTAAGRIAGTLRRAALATSEDLLRPAPSSALNARIGPGRILIRHSVELEAVREIRAREGGTVNDVCLAVATGALREVTLARGEEPGPLKAMVPVNVRSDEESGALGNRITLAFVNLPLDAPRAHTQLTRIRHATEAFKREGRPAGAEAVLGALGLLPDALRGVAARALAGPRSYNLTISNIPGPDIPLYMLGAELIDAYPVVPMADGHALAIGIFGYRDRLHFGLLADPDAFPQVRDLPEAMNTSLSRLLLSPRVQTRRGRPQGRPLRPAAVVA